MPMIKRHYAKTAVKTVNKINVKSLGPFVPKEPLPSLPEVAHLKLKDLNLKRNAEKVVLNINYENQLRFDSLNVRKMFFGSERQISCGTILLVDRVYCRSVPLPQSFCGVVLKINTKGVGSSVTIRSIVMGVGVDLVVPLFSPLNVLFTVLR